MEAAPAVLVPYLVAAAVEQLLQAHLVTSAVENGLATLYDAEWSQSLAVSATESIVVGLRVPLQASSTGSVRSDLEETDQ